MIDSSYDAYPNLIWNGGRRLKTYPSINIKDILFFFNKYPNIKLRYVFTNNQLTEQHLNNKQCNDFVQQYIRPQDEVIINSPLLINHFKENYPNINLIYSTTLDITNINIINNITKNNVYVLNYNYNNDNNYIQQIINKHNLEILCAEPCILNCPFRLEHYINISKDIINNDYENIFYCPFKSELLTFEEIIKLPHAVTNMRIK